MPINDQIADHYAHGALIEAIEAGVRRLGKTPETISVHDLAGVDEFHVGGRQASEDFFDQLGFGASHHLLDIGCGLGGAARFIADKTDCMVSGIDLTDEYIEAGDVLNEWTGLAGRVDLTEGSALDLPYEKAAFDGAYMLHVGMNIEDKAQLFSGIHACLKPGATFGIYDVMRTGDGDLAYPVPWAASEATSFLASPGAYRDALEAAGFEITGMRERRTFALDFFAGMKARMASAEGPPALGLHVLMGMNTGAKMQNIIANIEAGLIAPVELIARKT